MHAAYYRPGGVYRDLPDHMPKYKESPWHKGGKLKRFNEAREGSVLDYLEHFTREFPKRVVYEPVTSVEPRVGVPRVIRDDARYETAAGEAAQRETGR